MRPSRPRFTVAGTLALRWLSAFGLVVGGLFILTGLTSSFKTAFDVLTGTASPFKSQAGVAGVLLAITGYLVVPAVIGTLAAVFFDRQRLERTLEHEELGHGLSKIVGRRIPAPPRRERQ